MRASVWILAIFVLMLLVTTDGQRRKCRRKWRCKALTLPNTIRSNCQAPFRCGDECRYECVPGCVKRTGARVRVCRFGRYWRGGRGLKCSCRPCGSPPDVRDTSVSGCTAPFTAGTTCSYQCNPGFRKVGGGETRMCVDGRWEGSTLVCAARQCLTLTVPAFGSLTPPGPHSYPIRVTFTCNTGYVLNGGSSTTCQANGTWSDTVPTCTRVQCPVLTTPINGIRTPPTGADLYRDMVTFTCNTGYVRNGASSTTCQADGTWSDTVPTCTRVQCPLFWAPLHGALNPVGANSYQVVVRFTCYTGYVLNGAADTTCQADGTWSNAVPTCTPNGLLIPAGASSYQVRVMFICNPGYHLNGASSITCRADGTWSNSAPTCTPVQCPTLASPTNGALSPPGHQYYYPTQVTITCNSGYQLNGVSPVTCQAFGSWSNPVPTCTPSMPTYWPTAASTPTAPSVSSCGDLTVFNSDSGSFTSPGWPGPYPLSTNCTWQMNVSPGYVVLIRFANFDLEHGGRTCIWDSLRIHDGPNISSPIIANLCGSSVGPVITTGRSAFVVFYSDYSVTDSGFIANFTAWNDTIITTPSSPAATPSSPAATPSSPAATPSSTAANVSVPCGNPTVLSGNFGIFTSPDYPDDYPNNARCSWQISVNTGYVVAIRFYTFNLDGGGVCPYDYLEVYDGSSTAAPRLARLCGSSAPTVFTTGRNAFVVFQTDGIVTSSGFAAYYTAENRGTASPNTPAIMTTPPNVTCSNPAYLSGNTTSFTSPGYPGDYPNNARCSWHISVDTGYVVAIRFNSFNLDYNITNVILGRGCDDSDYLEVYDGSNTTAPRLGRLCGIFDRTILTTERNAFVVFQTDGSGTSSGFSAYFTAEITGCQPIRYSRCLLGLPYNQTAFPNFFQSMTQDAAIQNAEWFFLPYDLIRDCHQDFDFFVCSLSFPRCTSEGTILPCQSFCGEVDATCSSRALAVGLPWNLHTLCAFLPISDCVMSNGPTPPSVTCSNPAYLSGRFGSFTSPGYPGSYPNNTNCSWQISVDTGYVVAIRFNTFNLEGGGACPYDYLEVYDGSSTTAPRLARLCGSSAPTVFSSGRNAFVVFQTDGSGTRSGFSAYYTAEHRATCAANQFACLEGSCISFNMTCDGDSDCPDGSDEAICYYPSTCPHDQFQCNSSECVPLSAKCNGQGDCLDRSDEENCTCQPDQFLCDTSRCAPVSAKCNHHPDCLDWSDELNCTSSTCAANQFTCWEGSCISFNLTCDGNSDCSDGSDEVVCNSTQTTTPQATTTFKITSPPPSVKCSNPAVLTGFSGNFTSPGYPGNYPNNARCSWLITVSSNKVVVIRFIAFDLEYQGSCNYDSLTVHDGPNAAAPVLATLCGTSARPVATSGNNAFLLFTTDGSVTESGFFATFTAENPPTTCSPDEFTCWDGNCINMTLTCDSARDCADGSDEINCG
uniref:Cubilin n=1 Tax=Branchiostoma floridae TaxID=7739 RepID=C3YC36_BRAFL|eukprot:XP_002606058.1 hypothetical protein BRAFLDRAFT_92077 [Branchiostoma floridae]